MLFRVKHDYTHGSPTPYDAVAHWQLGWVHNWGELAICALMTMHGDMADASSS